MVLDVWSLLYSTDMLSWGRDIVTWIVQYVYEALPMCLQYIHWCSVLQEGMQAALAADFSMTQFNYLGRLLLVHGRYRFTYKHLLTLQFTHHSFT